MKIRIASALTKPVMTERETNCISRSSRRKPAAIWITPIRIVAAKRYSTPCSRTSGVTTTATAAVAAEIMAGRPPRNAITIAMATDAYNPTRGSTPEMIEKPMASGMSASETTMPARISRRASPAPVNHSVRKREGIGVIGLSWTQHMPTPEAGSIVMGACGVSPADRRPG